MGREGEATFTAVEGPAQVHRRRFYDDHVRTPPELLPQGGCKAAHTRTEEHPDNTGACLLALPRTRK